MAALAYSANFAGSGGQGNPDGFSFGATLIDDDKFFSEIDDGCGEVDGAFYGPMYHPTRVHGHEPIVGLFNSGKDDSLGASAPPCFVIRSAVSRIRLRVPVRSGALRTLSVKARQVLPSTPRPKMVLLENADIGVSTASVTAAPGVGWVTLSTTFTPSADGVVDVELWNMADGTNVEAFFDDLKVI